MRVPKPELLFDLNPVELFKVEPKSKVKAVTAASTWDAAMDEVKPTAPARYLETFFMGEELIRTSF